MKDLVKISKKYLLKLITLITYLYCSYSSDCQPNNGSLGNFSNTFIKNSSHSSLIENIAIIYSYKFNNYLNLSLIKIFMLNSLNS